MPGGIRGALVISVLTWLWAALASVSLLWPGFASSLHPSTWDDSLPDAFAGHRWQYEVSQLVPPLLFTLICVVFYMLGAPTRRPQVHTSLVDESVVTPIPD